MSERMLRLALVTRWLVYSYDDDEQQTFVDVVLAPTAEAAEDWVRTVRGEYATVTGGTTDLAESVLRLTALAAQPGETVLEAMRALADENPVVCGDCGSTLTAQTRHDERPSYCGACDREVELKPW